VADLLETTKLLDIDVDHLAGAGPFIAAHGFGWLQITHPVQSQPPQDTADGGGANAHLRRDVLAGVALTAQGLDGRAGGSRCLARR
jgi:hypothetical protein